MSPHPSCARFLLAAALVLVASGARAQSNGAIPEELVRALVANTGSDRPPAVIVVGGAPREFPADALPGGRVLGGVGGDPSAAEVAVVVPDAPSAAVEAAIARLAGTGWSSNGGRRQRGFVGPGSSPFGLLCRGSDGMTVSAIPGPQGGSYLRLSYMGAAHQNPCSGPAGMPRTMQSVEVPIPTLTAPSGAAVASTSNMMMMSSDGSGEARTRLRTSRSPSELLAHYAAQLGSDGWTASTPLAGGDAGIQVFRKHEADGKEWIGVLSAVALPGTDLRDMTFTAGPAAPASTVP